MARNSTGLAVSTQQAAEVLERVDIEGDLAALSPQERVTYYAKVCESLGLNPMTKPFEYIRLNNRLTLYAKRDATDQLRRIHGVSVEITGREMYGDSIYVVTARARDSQGRTDEAIGAVSIAGLKGDALANALMKAETKAKRRVTLSICGLGWRDGAEVATVPDAAPVDVDMETGEIRTPIKNVTPPKSESPPRNNATPKGGDEGKRDEYHAALAGYLIQAHGINGAQYVSLIDYAIGGTPQNCDIDKLADLARRAYAAGKQGNKSAAQSLARLVEDWRRASEADMVPDEVPGDEIKQE